MAGKKRTVDERAQDPDDLCEALDAARLCNEVLGPLDVLDGEHARQEVLLSEVLARLPRRRVRERSLAALPQGSQRRPHVPGPRARPELPLGRLGLGLRDCDLVCALLPAEEHVRGAPRRRHSRDALSLRRSGRAPHARDLLPVELEQRRVDLALCDGGLDARAAARGAHEAQPQDSLERLEGDDRLFLRGGALALASGHLEEEFEGLDGAERVGEDRVRLGRRRVVAGVARVRRRRGAEGRGEGRDGALQDRVVVQADEVEDRRDCACSRRGQQKRERSGGRRAGREGRTAFRRDLGVLEAACCVCEVSESLFVTVRENAPGRNHVRVRKVDSSDDIRWTLDTRPSSSAGAVAGSVNCGY